MRGLQQDHVPANFTFQFGRRAQSYQISFVHNGQAVAAFGFFHQMCGHQHRDVLFIAQRLQVLP